MFGHAQRRALAARTMTRTQWEDLHRCIRKARNRRTKEQQRAWELGQEVARLTGCDIGEYLFAPTNDVLAQRFYLLGGHGATRELRDPRDCQGIPGALRVRLALSWYPLPGLTYWGQRG